MFRDGAQPSITAVTASHDPRHTGQHRLGPHVIGQRVVVRRLVRGETGPSGGPAMTDLLGVCVGWDDSTCVVEPEEGEPVSIPIADIVSGKPVPPRASVRMRVPTREAERRTAALFEGVEVEPLGEWQLRWEPRPVGRARKRANSCLAIGTPAGPLPDALASVRSFYGDRGRPPLLQVERGSDVDAAATEAGWHPVPGGDADFLVTSAAMLRRRLRGTDGPVDLEEHDGRVRVSLGERASARAGLDDDWLGVHDVYVEPEHRRSGLATRLMAQLLDWGAEQGATTVWLHVETDNTAAQALYADLGFRPHHTCRYLTPDTSG